ncbi:OmpA family protein [Falsiroseomonas oryzae]|uniref:OmpA family protein n=1 Tax=Falsiroseomonas oryzae TaxID=2766473 RepID=UPI0022EBA330|nr:OmpA family protein [Roseomonas sp. MO-31]
MRRRAALAGIATLPAALLAACSATDPLGTQLAAQPVHVVFFEDDSVALGASALTVVQDAANIARRYPAAPIRVLGYVAPEPDHAPIMALARARAEHVAAELVRFGVPRARIMVSGRGAAPFAVDAPIEARRVEIHIGPG